MSALLRTCVTLENGCIRTQIRNLSFIAKHLFQPPQSLVQLKLKIAIGKTPIPACSLGLVHLNKRLKALSTHLNKHLMSVWKIAKMNTFLHLYWTWPRCGWRNSNTVSHIPKTTVRIVKLGCSIAFKLIKLNSEVPKPTKSVYPCSNHSALKPPSTNPLFLRENYFWHIFFPNFLFSETVYL